MTRQSNQQVVDEPPVVQESDRDGHVEIAWPAEDRVTVLPEPMAVSLFSDVMRVVTGVDPADQPLTPDDATDTR